MDLLLHGFVKVVKCISSRSKCRDLDHNEMEVLVVVKMVEMEVLVWTNKTSVKGEGKGSRAKGGLGNRTGHGGGGGNWSVRWWAALQTTSRRGVDLFSFFLINQGGALSSQKCLETEE